LESFGELAKRFKFIKEPIGRNTAPAIGLAAIYLNHLFPQSVMIVMPSDHAIPDREKFLNDLELAIQGAREDHLITFGIKPSRPETGYGYIKVEDTSNIGGKGLRKVECFVEKPDHETAKKYLSNGSYYWNSGIFIWKTSKILSEIKKYLPDLYQTLKEIESLLYSSDQPNKPNKPNERNRLNELYSHLEPISIDYGIMEQSQDVLMVPATFQWSDLGSWSALDEIVEKDGAGNIFKGNAIDIGSQNSTIYADKRIVATIGLKDMVVVDTPDATLITPKERVQEVRKIVEALKQNGREEYLIHKTVERPWGNYTVLEKGEGYKIKRVVLKPGAKLSLQLHKKRSEHWIVVTGTAKVTREDDQYLVHTNESTYIPINVKHRLENPGGIPLQVIEVQNGEYLEEDDIERFDDDYGRT
jgi:mannose-1-phosphate guanylyltransferase/mannose-6-phosphate isomerase